MIKRGQLNALLFLFGGGILAFIILEIAPAAKMWAERDVAYSGTVREHVSALWACGKKHGADRLEKCKPIASALAERTRIHRPTFYDQFVTSNFNVYVIGKRLLYVKRNCQSKDLEPDIFSVNFYPTDRNLLKGEIELLSGFISIDFKFSETGYKLDNVCIALTELLDSTPRQVVTGQFIRGAGMRWFAAFRSFD